MNNTILAVKVEQRVNKLSSADYGNIEWWMIIEAFNKAQDAWVRRQLEGINQTRTGNEGSIRRIDDLQCILTTWTGSFVDMGIYWESSTFPSDYLEWCRIDAKAVKECVECPPRPLTIFAGNEADVSLYLADANRQPTYDWATTFSTLINNKFRIWTNEQFDIVEPLVTYYKTPVHIQILGYTNPDTGVVSTVDVLCEFPDNVIELMIDDAAAILCRDMRDLQQAQALNQSAEFNN